MAGRAAWADGVLELRGAYYKERSTRVEQPMIDGAFDAGEHGRIEGHFLVDSITSASSATGTQGAQFTERRYEAAFGYTHELPQHVRIGGEAKYSTESDYFSRWIAGHAEVALFDQTTTFRLLLGHSFDTITNGIAVEMGGLGTPHIEHSLNTTLASLSATQVLAPWLVGGLTYDFMYLSGYQANLYRIVRGGVDPVAERVPELRVRNAIAASLRGFLAETRTTLVLAYRLYLDDWGIVAHTPEVRLVQEVMRGLDVRARYRYYTQTRADLYKPVYTQMELSDPTVYVTSDEKLSAFTTHTLGGQVSLALRALGIGGSLGDTRLDLIVERVWQSTTFGDAWVGQLGLAVPFVY
jgi:hypothetical protein